MTVALLRVKHCEVFPVHTGMPIGALIFVQATLLLKFPGYRFPVEDTLSWLLSWSSGSYTLPLLQRSLNFWCGIFIVDVSAGARNLTLSSVA